jgi:hypothetical protein
MHDGAFTSLEAAVGQHLDPRSAALAYDPVAQGLDPDLSGPIAPIEPILARLDPAVATPRSLSDQQIDVLVAFVRDGLLVAGLGWCGNDQNKGRLLDISETGTPLQVREEAFANANARRSACANRRPSCGRNRTRMRYGQYDHGDA